MNHDLPALPYAKDALQPHISAETLEFHHDKHHAGYTAKLNKALEAYPDFASWTALERINEAKATGADAIVTACGWCERVFKDTVQENRINLKVYDITELLEKAI